MSTTSIRRLALTAAFAAVLIPMGIASALSQDAPQPAAQTSPRELALVWTSGDPEVAHRMVLMYGHAAKKAKWFSDVRVIVWGPSSRLLAADKDIQSKIAAMQKDGVVVQACVVCAESYGVTQKLRDLGLEVKAMGGPLTELIKDTGVQVATF